MFLVILHYFLLLEQVIGNAQTTAYISITASVTIVNAARYCLLCHMIVYCSYHDNMIGMWNISIYSGNYCDESMILGDDT